MQRKIYQSRLTPSIDDRLVKATFHRKPVAREKDSIPGQKRHVSATVPVQLHELVWQEAEEKGVTVGTVISDIYNSADSISDKDLQVQQVLELTADRRFSHCYLATLVPVEDYQRFKSKSAEFRLPMRFLLKLLIRKRYNILTIDTSPVDP